MGINGAIAGLVAITAAPDTPSGGLATIIGGSKSLSGVHSIS